MGIGNSKMNAAEGGVVPTKLGPILVGRVEEIRKRVNGEGTISKKMLLKDSDEDDNNSRSSRATETEANKVSSQNEIQIQPPKEETVARAIAAEKLSRVVPLTNSEGETGQGHHPNKDNMELVNKEMDQTQDKVNHAVEMVEAEVKTEEGKNAEPVEEPKKEKKQDLGVKGDDHGENGNDNSNDSDDDDESEDIGRFLCPGSPSFRIYCIDSKKNNEEKCNSPTIFVHQKSHSADCVETAASRNSNKVLHDVDIESESTTKRKRNKKKFRPMKTLLKVKSCYHPMCTCTGEERTIVTAKPTK